jgi:hypothetical protein
MKTCRECGQQFSPYRSHQESCSKKCREKKAERTFNLRHKYGLTIEEYEQRLNQQGGVCAICKKAEPARRRYAVDHDHRTGVVRGLLCTRCNNALGCFHDDPLLMDRAAQYIRAAQG